MRGGSPPTSSANSIFFQRRIEFRRADREHLGAALRTRRGWQMQKCCDASVCQPRQALDQLFIRIEKIVTGRLDIIEISEFEWPQERNGRAGCADDHRLPSIRRKTHECGERAKPLELRSDSRLSGKKILANLSSEGEDLRAHWLATTNSLVTGPKTTATNEGARVHPALLPRVSTLPCLIWDPQNQFARRTVLRDARAA
jgi:hypothetical protein